MNESASRQQMENQKIRRFNIGEFFCGAGGMSLGAIAAAKDSDLRGRVELVPTWAVDFDKDACRTYHRNIHGKNAVLAVAEEGAVGVRGIDEAQGNEALVLNADVRKVNFGFLNSIDGFLFGFPCNDFSLAGQRKGLDGKFGMLYQAGRNLILEKKPKFFVAENVSGLLQANNYNAFIQIMEDLKIPELDHAGMGYTIVPHLYKFELYGVPQTRHRVIIVGIRNDVLQRDEVAKEGFRPPRASGDIVSVEKALSAPYPEGVTISNTEEKKISDIVRRRLEAMEPGQNFWEANKTMDPELRIKQTKTTISSIYRLLDPKKPAYTVVGSGGGGTHMYHWERRATTDRERARIQTFPDTFVFEGGLSSVRKQIGMAVPPKGAEVILAAVLKTLLGIEYDNEDPNLQKEQDPEYAAMKRARRKKELEARRKKEAAEELDIPSMPDIVPSEEVPADAPDGLSKAA